MLDLSGFTDFKVITCVHVMFVCVLRVHVVWILFYSFFIFVWHRIDWFHGFHSLSGNDPLSHFTEHQEGKLVSPPITIHEDVQTITACAELCLELDFCVSFNYDIEASRQCELLRSIRHYDESLALVSIMLLNNLYTVTVIFLWSREHIVAALSICRSSDIFLSGTWVQNYSSYYWLRRRIDVLVEKFIAQEPNHLILIFEAIALSYFHIWF